MREEQKADGTKRNRMLRLILGILLLTTLLGMGSVSASAKKVSTWYTSSSGRTYYYDENGEKLKDGKYKIGKKYYYFDKKGIQRTGWQKIGSKYYYFKIAKGKNGYMRHSTSKKTVTINGIKLAKSGRAKMTSYAKKKLPILYEANQKMQSITKAGDSKKTKLKKCWDNVISNLKGEVKSSKRWLRLSNLYPSGFWNSKNWDITYASRIFVDHNQTADCYTCGVVFAYLANACGYKANAVSSGGHGWAEINSKVYDPDWAVVKNSNAYFGLKLSGSYPSGSPNYKANRYYVITI